MLLYIDTISDLSKIIIFSDQVKEIRRFECAPDRNQTDSTLCQIDKLIDSQIDKISGIFFNSNAGSYTSMRIGLSIANSLGFALNIQPVGVTSPAEIKFEIRLKFTAPAVPVYKSAPVITKKVRL